MPELVCFSDAASLLKNPREKDILFLDIEMPGMDGLYVGNQLKRQNPNIIIFIVTSYSQYLDDTMGFHIFRYLSKPLDKQRFFRSVKEAVDLYYSTNTRLPIETKPGIHTILMLRVEKKE